MVYIISMKVDGGCRRVGAHGAIGACAAAKVYQNGNVSSSWSRALPWSPTPTNQRAEIAAITLALEKALEDVHDLNDPKPFVKVFINSDSKYAVGCMTEWLPKWLNNGWINSAGGDVANKDLIEEAVELQDRLEEYGDVEYKWVPRVLNEYADRLCNEMMDEMEQDSDY